jgi:hypothetical protein
LNSENKFVCVKADKSPYDGDIGYWSERNSKLYDGQTVKILKKQHHSCASCGLTAMCTDVELRANAIEHKLEITIQELEFKPYLQIFEKFGFGQRLSVLMLVQIYPFEKFLVNGQPIIDREISAIGKKQKRYRSLRSFQLYLGLGYKWKQSGDQIVRFLSGSSICRAHLFMWAFDRIAPLPPRRLPTEIGNILGAKYDLLRRGSVKLSWKDAQVRVLYRTTALLFRELCNHLL